MPIKSTTFESATDIRYEIQVETSEDKPRFSGVLVLSFFGHYRPGHLGAPDGEFMRGIMQAALGVWRPAGLILDFRRLDYVWGDEMEEVLGCRGEIRAPYAVVLGDRCGPAITTLVRQFHPGIASETELDHIFDDMEEAWRYVHQQA